MATIEQIRHNPSEYLGAGATDEDLGLFIAAVQQVFNEALHDESPITEQEAVDRIWGNGDWTTNAERILGLR